MLAAESEMSQFPIVQDQFAKVQKVSLCPSQFCLSFALPAAVSPSTTAMSFVVAAQVCSMDFCFHPQHFRSVMSICGPAFAALTVADFWTQVFSNDLQQKFGISLRRKFRWY